MDRRRFLASAGGAASGLLAGCVSQLGSSESSNAERPLEPVTRWALPVDDASEPIDGYQVLSIAPASLVSTVDGIDAGDLSRQVPPGSFVREYAGIEAIDRLVEVNPRDHPTLARYTVYEGDFDAEALAEGIGSHPMISPSTVGEHEGHDLLRTVTDGGDVVLYAVSDRTAIIAYPYGVRTRETDPIRRVVDAGRGETDTIVDQHAGARTIAERLSPGHQLRFSLSDPDEVDEPNPRFGVFGGIVASGSAADVAGDVTELHYVRVFEDASALATAQLEEWLVRFETASAVDSVSTETDGWIHETTITASTDAILGRRV